jgi:SAM-dependent methyltransferase
VEGKSVKVRESGMPNAEMWHSFFAPDTILAAMGLTADVRNAVDFGCGYGTFAIPAAKRINGTLYAFDIDPPMVETTRRFAERENVRNIRIHLRDFLNDGTGLVAASVDYAMLFNILHADDPLRLLREAWRVLAAGGHVAVIHWNYDPKTPRGPPMAIRPRPEDCRRWTAEAGFAIETEHVALPPYHYGILGRKERA